MRESGLNSNTSADDGQKQTASEGGTDRKIMRHLLTLGLLIGAIALYVLGAEKSSLH
jgi:hypothetical protein